ncbi:hypothetical protein ONE63_011302 [Megalurothrips usitatus]|uniref:DDE Tnp4 domain-containing protein n=1 Tax=Megalurothrips usitatus TaxID=439358 RepID=A0AAV7X4W8_9NEOP|nr:hypothetical protein ONE63_011302 [Megalurothrips usitatus]
MRKDSYQELVRVIAPLYEVKCNRGDAPPVTVEKATLMALWYLAANVSMYKAGDRFGVASSTLFKEVHKIVDILCQLCNKFIVWPTEAEATIIRQQFKDRAGYPGVIGAIDGCHIDVLVPANDQQSYIDRKMNHSILLQGICTATKLFTNVSIGTPGSWNDCRALRYSSFYQRVIQEGPDSLFFNANNHLVGDKAYPNRIWLLTPYKDNGNLTLLQRQHNYIHSSTRTVIEHCFGLLKGRWRCLLRLQLKRIDRASNFIMACCVLHNFCFLHNDAVIEDMVNDERHMPAQVTDDYHDAHNAQLAKEKRDRIASVL